MPKPIDADLSGKTCIVTGANTGIGKQIARELARMKATVVLGCRNAERGRAALEELKQATGNESLELGIVDLSQHDSIKAFARTFQENHERLDVLVNNAGIWCNEHKRSEDGLELTFATNVLGYFRLTNELEELLQKSAPARIVNVASNMAGGLDLSDLNLERRGWDGVRAYKQSKQSNRMLSWQRARNLEGSGVTVNAMHPGPVRTEIARDARGIKGFVVGAFYKLFGVDVDAGADTAVWLAASPEVEGQTGKFWLKRKEQRRVFHDPVQEQALWDTCLELSGSAAQAAT